MESAHCRDLHLQYYTPIQFASFVNECDAFASAACIAPLLQQHSSERRAEESVLCRVREATIAACRRNVDSLRGAAAAAETAAKCHGLMARVMGLPNWTLIRSVILAAFAIPPPLWWEGAGARDETSAALSSLRLVRLISYCSHPHDSHASADLRSAPEYTPSALHSPQTHIALLRCSPPPPPQVPCDARSDALMCASGSGWEGRGQWEGCRYFIVEYREMYSTHVRVQYSTEWECSDKGRTRVTVGAP